MNIVRICCKILLSVNIHSFILIHSTPYEMEADSNIKRCPQCRYPLEWIAGCAQIMCVNCKHIFCWYCLKSLDVNILHIVRQEKKD